MTTNGSILLGNGSLETSPFPFTANYPQLDLGQYFTIEFFIKDNGSVSATFPQFFSDPSGQNNTFAFWINRADAPGLMSVDNDPLGYNVVRSTTNVCDNQWHHIAVVRNGFGSNNITMYVDGISESVGTNSDSTWKYSQMRINGNQTFPGYFTNMRFLNGTALYTSNFSVPTTDLTNITNTVLLLNTYYESPYTDSSSTNVIFVNTQGSPTPTLETPFTGPVICFKENSKILCLIDGIEKEIFVQDIRNGVLVKTSLNGYLPVKLIGTSKINNPGNSDRIVDRLYLCSKKEYPELNEDLVITGAHAILVNELTDKQKEETMEMFDRIFITDDKYRLIAHFDDRAIPYEVAGEHNIYHIALENENIYYNYGIYANGLLVESCSIRYLRELSNMTFL